MGSRLWKKRITARAVVRFFHKRWPFSFLGRSLKPSVCVRLAEGVQVNRSRPLACPQKGLPIIG